MRYEIIQNLEDSTFFIRKTRNKNHTFKKSRVAKKYLNRHIKLIEKFNILEFMKDLLDLENHEIFSQIQEQANEALRFQRDL